MRKILVATVIALAVGSCAAPPPEEIFVRLDGRSVQVHPELKPQFEADQTACIGEMQKASLSGVTVANGSLAAAIAQGQRNAAAMQVAKGCMAEKGYIAVPVDQAAARSAEFAKAQAQITKTPAKSKK